MAPTEQQYKNIQAFINKKWDEEVVPMLSEYIKIPNQSKAFDAEYLTNGFQEKAMNLLVDWVNKQDVKGMKVELLEEKGKTPFLIIEIDGTVPTAKTLLMYGHMDKQPPLRPWAEGLDPYTPVIKDEKLYGRGGADDGYAVFASLLSVSALQKEGLPHSRTVIVIEADEESGSTELPYWINKVKSRIGDVDLVITLDSGSLSYDRLYTTASLRGVIVMTIEASTAFESMHSGVAGGVLGDSTRVLRYALEQVEDSKTGNILLPELHCEIPSWVREGLGVVNELGFDELKAGFPFRQGVEPECNTNALDCALRNFWSPSLTIVGVDGMPSVANAGNVLRELTRFRLSIRVPPAVDAKVAADALVRKFESVSVNGCKVKAVVQASAKGWAAPNMSPWLVESLKAGSNAAFQKPFAVAALGGTIPFLGMLGEMFPKAEFVISGVLGPGSNAHGPNEFLLIPYGKKVNECMVRVCADHHENRADK